MAAAGVSVRKVGSVAMIAASDPLCGAHLAAMLPALDAALDSLATLSGIRAAVLIRENVNHALAGHVDEFALDERQCHRMCARLEQLPFPLVAALHGLIQGVELGVALACHYRVAVANTRFAAPEIGMGLIPDAGCTQRMPRLIGVEHTLEFLLGAKSIGADVALEYGLLDSVIADDLQQGALIFAEQLIVDAKGPRRTCDLQVNSDSGSDAILDRLFQQAGKQYPNRIAPYTAIKAVRSSMQLSFARGVELETELLAQARHTSECRAALHVLAAEQAARNLPEGIDAQSRPIKKVAIVGVGNMGAGIAICCANAGVPVTVIDVDGDALERGLAAIDRTYESMVRRGRLTAAEMDKRFGLITGSLDYADLQHVDLVIESVFEDVELKRQVFARLNEVTREGTVLASTTSTVDIDLLGAMTARPDEVIGTHFFAPAQSLSVVEVVRGDATSAATVRAVLEFMHALHRTPVVTLASEGFIGNRMLGVYTCEAKRMTLEGVAPQRVDELLERWGMAMGPLAATDLTGIDVAMDIQAALRHRADAAGFQSDYALYEAGRLGQKNCKGYYHYDLNSRMRHPDPEVLDIFKTRAARLGIDRYEHASREIIERCLYPLINEGLRILEEGVALRPGDIDVLWIDCFGFPRYRGGPMFYADIIGLPTLLSGMRRYQKKFESPHWRPAALLERLVSDKQTLREWYTDR